MENPSIIYYSSFVSFAFEYSWFCEDESAPLLKIQGMHETIESIIPAPLSKIEEMQKQIIDIIPEEAVVKDPPQIFQPVCVILW